MSRIIAGPSNPEQSKSNYYYIKYCFESAMKNSRANALSHTMLHILTFRWVGVVAYRLHFLDCVAASSRSPSWPVEPRAAAKDSPYLSPCCCAELSLMNPGWFSGAALVVLSYVQSRRIAPPWEAGAHESAHKKGHTKSCYLKLAPPSTGRDDIYLISGLPHASVRISLIKYGMCSG